MSDVREATEADVDALLDAYEWLFEPPGSVPPRWDRESARAAIVRTLGSDRSTIFVSEDDGRLSGLCSACIDLDSVRFGTRCWVEDLVVDPGQRSRGTGKALLDAAKDWARGKGASHLELDSGTARTEAHRFYEREQPSWESKSYAWEL